MAVQLEPDIPTRGAQTASEEPPELLEESAQLNELLGLLCDAGLESFVGELTLRRAGRLPCLTWHRAALSSALSELALRAGHSQGAIAPRLSWLEHIRHALPRNIATRFAGAKVSRALPLGGGAIPDDEP